MKRILYFLTIQLFALPLLITSAQAQRLDNVRLGVCDVPPYCQEAPICTYTDDCFKIDYYSPKDQGDGTSVLKFKITNYSESTFTNATFELPGQGAATNPAVSPNTTFSNRYNHNVVNPFQDSLIAFNAINAGTFSYGGFEMYYYVVNNADLYAPSGRKVTVTAKAGRPWQLQRFGQVVVDLDLCEGAQPCPQPTATISGPDTLCLFSDDPFIYTTNAVANATYTWTINNATITAGQGTNSIEVMADVDAGPGSVTVVVANACGSVTATKPFTVIEDCDLIDPLPVELISFTGRAANDGINLNWRTATEKNNDRFEIERSQDGRNFEIIGTVRGNGNSNSAINYSFTDKNARAGINYYRLNQVDFNGDNERSKIIKVTAERTAGDLTVKLLPNPCRDENCMVQLQGIDSNAKVTLELRDLTGRLIFSKQIAADQTSFQMPRVDTGKGIYILTATNGNYTAHQKIVIQ
ncbi:MAG TPA: T9SS type A sorting domain-containing protein [Adhaeribacter sp.]|nr:T9SS type A sorting domain-containing protein [Adhaeribacter sp.]